MEDYPMDAMGDGSWMAMGAGVMILYLAIFLFLGFCVGKLFEKAGKPLWAGFVPIYNIVVMLEVVGRPLWWIVLLLIPFVNIVVGILVYIDLAKSYGKDVVWGILLIFFGIIMLPIMAFSSDIKYVGPAAKG